MQILKYTPLLNLPNLIFSTREHRIEQRLRRGVYNDSLVKRRHKWYYASHPQEGARLRGHVRVQKGGDQRHHAPPRHRLVLPLQSHI